MKTIIAITIMLLLSYAAQAHPSGEHHCHLDETSTHRCH
jgi:hypothetical protein